MIARYVPRYGFNRSALYNERGLTIVELLVGFLLTALLMAAALFTFRDSTGSSSDNEVISAAEEKARDILEMIAYDLRHTGSGMPLGQVEFRPGGTGLGTAPLPVLLTATSTYIQFRMNPLGRDTVVTSDYTPSLVSLSIDVHDNSDFKAGDTIYLNSATAGDDDGLMGTVANTPSGKIMIDSTYATATGAQFDAGSLVTRVDTITYESKAADSTIHRIDENGDVTIAENSAFTLEYLDVSGTTIALPLTNVKVEDDLGVIRLTVTVDGERPLSDDTDYTATATQVINLRNLNLARTNS